MAKVYDYDKDDYVSFELVKPIELKNGDIVSIVDAVPFGELYSEHSANAKIDLKDPNYFNLIIQVLSLTARNAETGIELPRDFYSKLKNKNLNAFSELFEGDLVDPEA